MSARAHREAGVEAGAPRWFGAFMPPCTAPEIAQSVAKIIAEAIRDRDVRDTWHNLTLVPQSSTPMRLREPIRAEHSFRGKAVAEFNFTPEA